MSTVSVIIPKEKKFPNLMDLSSTGLFLKKYIEVSFFPLFPPPAVRRLMLMMPGPKKSGNCEILVFDMHHKSPGDHLYIYLAMVNIYQRRKGGPHAFGGGGGGAH